MVSGVDGKTPMNFWTLSGVAVPAVATDQMREIDRIAIEDTGPNLFQMMENADRNVPEMALECLGTNWRHARVIVLAGSGGNRYGGIVAARHLANHGAQVDWAAPKWVSSFCLISASQPQLIDAPA